MKKETEAVDKISTEDARAWRAHAQRIQLDPEMQAVLVRAWHASHTAAQTASVVVSAT
jgi:hypothetical protein